MRARRLVACVAALVSACTGAELSPRASSLTASNTLYDDFEDGLDKWMTSNGGWTLENGQVCETGADEPLSSLETFHLWDLYASVEIASTNLSTGGIALSPFAYVSRDSSTGFLTQIGYFGEVLRLEDGSLKAAIVQAHLVPDGDSVFEETHFPIHRLPKQLGLRVDREMVSLWLDGELIGSVPRVAFPQPLTKGHIAFGNCCFASDNTRTCFDNVHVGFSLSSACPCEEATNHGTYVRCVRDWAVGAAQAGVLDKDGIGRVVSEAARSSCGKKGP